MIHVSQQVVLHRTGCRPGRSEKKYLRTLIAYVLIVIIIKFFCVYKYSVAFRTIIVVMITIRSFYLAVRSERFKD